MINRLEEIRNSIYKYLETKLELFKMELQGGFEKIIIQLLYLVILIILSTVTLVFLFIMLAVFLNQLLNSNYAGFAIVSGLVAVLTLLWALNGRMVQVLIRKLLHWVFSKR